MEFLDKMLNDLETEVPQYLKILLLHCGFDNILSFSKFSEQDMEKMENHARNVLSQVLEEDEKKKLFGIYFNKPDLFTIPEGHKKIMHFLKEESARKVNALKRPIDEGISEHNKRRMNVSEVRSKNNNPRGESSTLSRTPDGDSAVESKLDDQAIEHIKLLIKNYIKKFCEGKLNEKSLSQDQVTHILLNLRDLEVTLTDIYSAKIQCTLCNFKSSGYSVQNSKTGRKWNISNFLKHFRTHFKENKKVKGDLSKKSFNKHSNKPSSILKFVTVHSNGPTHSQSNNHNYNIINNEHTSEQTTLGIPSNSVITLSATSETTSQASSSYTNPETFCDLTFYDTTEDQAEDTVEDTINDNRDDDIIYMVEDFITDSASKRTPELTQCEEVIEETISLLPIDNNQEITSKKTEAFAEVGEVCSKGGATRETHSSDDKTLAPPIVTPEITPRVICSQSCWISRHQRNIRKFQELPHNQRKITEFLEILTHAIENNPEASKTISTLVHNKAINKNNLDAKGLLKHLLDSAKRNCSNKSPHSNQFTFEMKRFWLYIFITAGRLSYEILCSNLKNIVPSMSTLNRELEETGNIKEGVVIFDELKLYLKKRNYPNAVFISEDQTALVKRVQYDPSSNKMIGFVARLTPNGFPDTEQFIIHSISDIQNAFKNESIAINAYVYVAQPLVDGAPGFCVSILGSDNRFTTDDVSRRWSYLEEEAAKHGIQILGFSSDGDSRCLKSMKMLTDFPSVHKNPYEPYFKMKFDTNLSTVVQDTVHISTKLKTRMLNEKISLQMGDKKVAADHVRTLIETFSKDKHMLCPSHLQGTDKMNFEAIDKMASDNVIQLLKEIPDAEATSQYLLLTRCILNSFLAKDITVERRVYLMWYVTFFCRLWTYWLNANKMRLQSTFLTTNAYTCIELNSHALLVMIHKLRSTENGAENPELFLPWLYSSQPCEKLFRQARAMSSTFSTMVNFSLLEMLRRLKRIQALHEISADLGTEFTFPREEHGKLGVSSVVPIKLPSEEEIKLILENAKNDARNSAKSLNMIVETDVCFENVNVPSIVNITQNASKNINTEEDQEGETETENEDEESTIIVNDDPDKSFNLDSDISDKTLMEKEMSVLQKLNFETLNFKDYTGSKCQDKTCLTLLLNNGKHITVKKSTLCWFFSEKKGRLSSDRILRVRGMNGKDTVGPKPSQKHFGKVCKSRKRKKGISKLAEIESSSSDSDAISLTSETLSETFSDFEDKCDSASNNDLSIEPRIEMESYYAIYYDNMWYIGRITKQTSKRSGSYEVKFLQKDLDKYKWPQKDDVQNVDKIFIFHGPLNLIGSNPFSIRRSDTIQIEKKYKDLKRKLKHS